MATVRKWIKEQFEANPYTVITMDQLVAAKSGWTPKQIRSSIANLRHEIGAGFPLRVAATEPRAGGRPGAPSASAWIHEPSQDASSSDEVTLDETGEHSVVRPRRDVLDEGYRWTPTLVATDVAIDEATTNESEAVAASENGHRVYYELATTRLGAVLVEDEDGKVYRLVGM